MLNIVLIFVGLMMIIGMFKKRTNGGGGVPAPAGNGNLPRSIRLNNPLALVYSEFNKWQGQIGSDGYLAVFESPEFGIRAGLINLRNGYLKKGFNTIDAIIRKYVGSKAPEQVITNYINKVSRGLNISAHSPLMPSVIPALAYEIHIFEAGAKYYDKDTFFHVYRKYNI